MVSIVSVVSRGKSYLKSGSDSGFRPANTSCGSHGNQPSRQRGDE
jgi:hypothetical protein